MSYVLINLTYPQFRNQKILLEWCWWCVCARVFSQYSWNILYSWKWVAVSKSMNRRLQIWWSSNIVTLEHALTVQWDSWRNWYFSTNFWHAMNNSFRSIHFVTEEFYFPLNLVLLFPLNYFLCQHFDLSHLYLEFPSYS